MLKENLKITFNLDKNTILFFATVLAYIIFSIVMISSRIPFFDEVNSWNIAANCNFSELLEVCKHEGHFMLWYLPIKPFASNNIGFPQALFAMNWLFAFAAVIVLWLKAPFNPWLKMFITFSLPIQMFTIYARCYAIGVLILFILCAMYKNRNNHPIIFSSLIVLLANTSVIGTVAAFFMGIIYLIGIAIDIKNKKTVLKNILIPTGIFLLGAIIVLFQIANFTIPSYSLSKDYLWGEFLRFFKLYDFSPKSIVIVLQTIMLLAGIGFFKENKLPYLFVILNIGTMFYIAFNVYGLTLWHYMFMFIFFVCSVWMYLSEYKISTKFQKIYYAFFIILSFNTIFFYEFPWQWNGFHMPTTYYLQENIEKYNNTRIFLYPTDSSIIGIVPMMRQKNIEFYDAKGYSYKKADVYIKQWEPKRIDFKGMKNVILSSETKKKNFLFVAVAEDFKKIDYDTFIYLASKQNELCFIPYETRKDVIIYEIVAK